MKKVIKGILIIVAVLLLVLGGYLGYLIFGYYRLPDGLTLEVKTSGTDTDFRDDFKLEKGGEYSIMTYNTGFGAYTSDYSFFMDGGKYSWAKDEDSVLASVAAMGKVVSEVNPDFVLLQELDRDGTRSYHVDELEVINQFITGYYYDFAQNYDSPFLFYPFWQPHGKNVAGLATYSRSEISGAVRRSLPISESFSRYLDLDRCYSVSRVPTENGNELCIYHVHMSAYGSNDEVREGQFSMLLEDMNAEYQKGNYVICGGDYNHNVRKGSPENMPEWAYPFPRESIPEGLFMAIDVVENTEDIEHDTCRSAGEPYREGETFTVTLDGFIVSENIEVKEYRHMDLGYAYSDHDPVVMRFVLE